MRNADNIGSPKRLRDGYYDGQHGTFWAWPVDGYYDLHHAPVGVHPDGSDIIGEFYATITEARSAAREWHNWDDKMMLRTMGVAR